ncbi:hypothetical protein PR202_ga22634 [Eleusine coracana subsp. coracana]|uniref:Uncharacterized protein n=1 Tax=Eleusine coracana subsp. coracana TaxID=191504 RepID=A0AAV5D286_ELECO|nr:hypothetical protein PR202_ga22634 [Eleusine coracana subsp. coracana]
MENALTAFKDLGVKAINESGSELYSLSFLIIILVACRRIQASRSVHTINDVFCCKQYQVFKISGHELVDPKDGKAVAKLLECGNIMVGRFKLSRNYYSVEPGHVYVYDEDMQIFHPKSGLPASHGAMMMGAGRRQTRWSDKTGSCRPVYSSHMVMQNSEGETFGIDGIGRIGKNSIMELYRIHWILFRAILSRWRRQTTSKGFAENHRQNSMGDLPGSLSCLLLFPFLDLLFPALAGGRGTQTAIFFLKSLAGELLHATIAGVD